MQRRNFLKNSLLVGTGKAFINNIPMTMFGLSGSLLTESNCSSILDRVLVLIRMEGGNDGLNTIIPVSQYNIYRNSRPNIAINETGTNAYIPVDNSLPDSKKVGLHPAMVAFKDLYDAGKLNIINGAGYANNNRSHFKATDLWFSAGDSTPEAFDYTSGFMGRYLDFSYPGLINNPTASMPDPLGLELGSSSASLGFKAESGQYTNVLLTVDASSFSTYVSGLGGAPDNPFANSQMGNRLAYLRNVELSINAYSTRITNTYNAGNNLATYPANSNLSNQLKTVARIIKGGSKTKIFLVQCGSFDTHANQVVSGNTGTGNHANLLKDLADSIKAFQTDLQLLNIEDKVVTATFTEFGRTLNQNGNLGTDHGGVNNMFIIGKGVNGGVTGNVPDLTNVVDGGVMDLQVDYRSVYASLLQDFLGAGQLSLAAAKLELFSNSKPPIIKETTKADPACYTSVIVPVKLTSLKATLQPDGTVLVSWQTEQESNSSHFEIEKADAQGSFVKIGRVNAEGYSSTTKRYSFTDTIPFRGINQYRLKQLDRDGAFSYYGPVAVRVNRKSSLTVQASPNPCITELKIRVGSDDKTKADIVIYDTQGHAVFKQKLNINKGENNARIDATRFPNGMLVLVILFENGAKHIQQIMHLK
jgi:uncharacterized protein (DUF1501 family)